MSRPLATYRLQMGPALTFADAAALAGYISRLGASHLYLSPVFESSPGSEHGYDVTDPTRVREELGGEAGFRELVEAARRAGLGVILDVVPNHMAARAENPWWWDLLARGVESPYSGVFDVDWDAAKGKIVLPVLGDETARVLERGEIVVDDAGPGGEACLRYYERRFPLARGTVRTVRERGVEAALEEQAYELIHWKAGAEARNYRRFFDINDLVAVRVEDEAVFERTHALIERLWDEGLIDGLRVDHVDGLARPGAYLRRLRRLMSGREGYLVVEKILAVDERLPGWPVDGTTGYEALNAVNRAFVAVDTLDAMRRIGSSVGADSGEFEGLVRRCKRLVIDELFPGEAWSIASALQNVAPTIPVDHLADAVREVAAQLGVYRTYLADGDDPDGRRRVEEACARAAEALDERGEAVGALRAALLGESGGDRAARERVVVRFEQFTGPAMAKGLEDTALYRDASLTALNEVGGEPLVGADPVADFHAFFGERAARGDGSLLGLSTHDTKRGEDARARILALGAFPKRWEGALLTAERVMAPFVDRPPSAPAPRAPTRSLLVQALFGVAPAHVGYDEDLADRLSGYALKAAREAKTRTSWTEQDGAYEEATVRYARALVLAPEGFEARAALREMEGEVGAWGAAIALAQTVLRLTLPGVPDTYQGSEREALTLVDPDNRRPVDWDACAAALEEDDEAGELAWPIAGRKARLVRALHGVRRAHAGALVDGVYERVEANAGRGRVLAFRRGRGRCAVIVAVPVEPAALACERLTIGVSVPGLTDALGGGVARVEGGSVVVERPWRGWPAVVLAPGSE